jgi:hypothetical protein
MAMIMTLSSGHAETQPARRNESVMIIGVRAGNAIRAAA